MPWEEMQEEDDSHGNYNGGFIVQGSPRKACDRSWGKSKLYIMAETTDIQKLRASEDGGVHQLSRANETEMAFTKCVRMEGSNESESGGVEREQAEEQERGDQEFCDYGAISNFEIISVSEN